ncbi:MAG: TonB-dependent receptor [Bacteroides sp.]|nr:TonB-dependent receptor [Bacteroides sp.]MCM1085915.1 TonB-dependent receptor [Bacteroides sp.]
MAQYIRSVFGKVAFFSLLFFPISVQAQHYHVIKGQIYDQKDKLVLPQAQVMVVDRGGQGAVADIDGNYVLAVERAEVELYFRYLGYEDKRIKVSFAKGETTKILNVGMNSVATTLEAVQIQGSRLERDGKSSIQTMEVVGLESIAKNNVTTLDRALKGVAGLAIVDNEPQMRGGSGFSSGMGSRVMLLLDNMPMLRADAGRPAWNLISMEDVEQIDVLKGAASVLYGSAAINGAINVHTKYATNKPNSTVKLYCGLYAKPNSISLNENYEERNPKPPFNLQQFSRKVKDKSWAKGLPMKSGISLAHSRKMTRWWDFTASVDYDYDDGYRLSGSEHPDDHVEHAETRVRASMGNLFHINDKWTFSLNANFLFSRNSMYNFWANAIDGKYKPFGHNEDGKWTTTLSKFKDIVLLVDPHLKYVSPKGGVHELDNRYMFSNNNVLNITGQDAHSHSAYNSYRYRKVFKRAADLGITTGITNQYTFSGGEVFSGDAYAIGSEGAHESDNLAVFVKLDKPFLKDKNLKLELGGRFEAAFVDAWHEMAPVFQLGLNYDILQSGTTLRLSAGQGYRAATIGEKFITTRVGMYGFYPNPDLKSERSLNFEFGIRQMFKNREDGKSDIFGYVDVAAFHQIYWNYIEFFMGPWNPDGREELSKRFGFEFFNTGRATITGVEASLMTQFDITEKFSFSISGNYTYSLPVCKEPDKVYRSTSSKDYKYSNSSSNTEGNILKYRIQHMAKFDIDFKFWKIFSIGAGIQYMSAMKNVDGVFVEMDKNEKEHADWLNSMDMDLPFYGICEFMRKHDWGSIVLDLRASVDINRFTISFVVNNALNAEYSLRPLYIEAPLSCNLQVVYRFQDINPLTWFHRKKADVARL